MLNSKQVNIEYYCRDKGFVSLSYKMYLI